MDTAFRKILFIACLITFIILCPILLAYSLGYNFNPKTKKIVSTGSILVKSATPKLSIYVDNAISSQTTAAYLENLEPKDYSIIVTKEGFTSWNKTLSVTGGHLTIAENILILPLDPRLSELANNLEWMEFSPSKNFALALQKSQPEISTVSLQFIDLSINDFPAISNIDSQYELIHISQSSITWSQTEKKTSFFAELKNGQKGYFILFIQNGNLLLSMASPEKNLEQSDSKWHSSNDNMFLYSENGKIYQFNIRDNETSRIELNAKNFIDANNKIFYIQEDSGLIYYIPDTQISSITSKPESDSNSARQFTNTPIPDFFKNKKYKLVYLDSGNILIQDSSNNLYLTEEQNIKKIQENISGFEISPLGKNLLIFNEHSVGITKTETEIISPDSKQLISRTEKQIKKAAWFDSCHVAYLLSDGEFYITELDGRGNRNTIKPLPGDIGDFWIEYPSSRAQIYPTVYIQKEDKIYKTDWNKGNEVSVLDLL